MKSRPIKIHASNAARRGRRPSLAIILVVTTLCIAVIALFWKTATSSAQAPNSCVRCHAALDERLSDSVRLFEHDIHKERGLTCTDCHGGDGTQDDMKAAKDPAKGYIGKPSRAQIPAFCGKCHSDASLMKKFNPSLRVDQVQEYFTSVHGTRLRNGDQNVATCVSCHGVHGIRKPDDQESSVFPMNVAETCAKCHADAEHMSCLSHPSRSIRQIQVERACQGVIRKARSIGSDVQRLPRKSRRRAAGTDVRCQCVRAVPRPPGGTFQK